MTLKVLLITLSLMMVLASSMIISAFGLTSIDTKSIENKTPSLPSMNSSMQGILIVTDNIINDGGGSKNASDFIIDIHGNNPSPSSFPGSTSGTTVKLDIGMYSVTQSGSSGYNATYSGDCSGAVMSSETKRCTITNMYIKPVIGFK